MKETDTEEEYQLFVEDTIATTPLWEKKVDLTVVLRCH